MDAFEAELNCGAIDTGAKWRRVVEGVSPEAQSMVETCAICGKSAEVEEPELSTGALTIDCEECGTYQVPYMTYQKIEEIRTTTDVGELERLKGWASREGEPVLLVWDARRKMVIPKLGMMRLLLSIVRS